MKNKKVDFLIIGAQKAGTTSLYEYLKQHKDIQFSSSKENLFFSNQNFYEKGEQYLNSFFRKSEEKILGTADVQLLPSLKGPSRVKAYNPKMKIIAILRDPTLRAYSAFNFAKQKAEEQKNKKFIQSFVEFKTKFSVSYCRDENAPFDYFYDGLYYKHLTNWMKYFPKNQIYITHINDLKQNPQEIINEVCNFLELEMFEIENDIEANKTGQYRFSKIQKLLFNRNSTIPKIIGYFIPQRTKNYIRNNFIKKIRDYSFKESKIQQIRSNEKINIQEFFEEDQKCLIQLLEK